MKRANLAVVITLTALSLLSGASFAQGRPDFGKNEFQASCASCHGVSGKGDGAMSKYLVKAPSDITTLAKRNGGVFPSQRVWETIDGRASAEIGAHGTREMPVWGLVYQDQVEGTPHQTEWYAVNRMALLFYYLARIQEQ